MKIFIVFWLLFSSYNKEYEENHLWMAKSANHTYKVPIKFIIAQAILESNYGESKAAVEYNNHFGRRCKINHAHGNMSCKHYVDAGENCYIKVYGTVYDCYMDQARYLTTGRYAKCLEKSKGDPNIFAEEVAKLGYAADRDYSNKLKKIISLINF
jgi:flagellum-specific peptidoglycan hydrolase FlgJ